MSVMYALLITLKANPGREDDVEQFLENALSLVKNEAATVTWYALRQDLDTFNIFDTFKTEEDRDAHLSGDLAEALNKISAELLVAPPHIRPIEILAVKSVE